MQTTVAPTQIIPEAGETQPDFAIRFHEAMQDRMPQTDRRDATMMAVWREHRGEDPLERIGVEKFAKDHRLGPEVCVFSEHTTKKGDELQVYDRNALVSILNRCNHRIADTGDFSPITDGHTPDVEAEEQGAPMPDILGYSGPYRLGMIGNENPRWAIYAREWHDNDFIDRIRRLPRRSPEVWAEGRMRDRFFDPIAALGARTPRLDMGITRFCRTADGRTVMKYSTAAFPSAMDTFVPAHGSSRRDNYQGDEMDSPATTGANPELVQELIDALMQTKQMQWVVEQMNEQPGGDMPPDSDLPAPEPASEPAAESVPEAPPAEAPAAEAPPAEPPKEDPEPYQCDDEDTDQMRKYMSGECDADEMEEYRRFRGRRRGRSGAKKNAAGFEESPDASLENPEPYSKRARKVSEADRYQKLQDRVDRQEEVIKGLERRNTEADRYAKLLEIRYAVPDLDLESEVAECSPDNMSDKEFDRYAKALEKRGAPMNMVLPTPDLPPAERTTEQKASVDRSDRATKYAMAQREKGVAISYDEALQHVISEENGTHTATTKVA